MAAPLSGQNAMAQSQLVEAQFELAQSSLDAVKKDADSIVQDVNKRVGAVKSKNLAKDRKPVVARMLGAKQRVALAHSRLKKAVKSEDADKLEAALTNFKDQVEALEAAMAADELRQPGQMPDFSDRLETLVEQHGSAAKTALESLKGRITENGDQLASTVSDIAAEAKNQGIAYQGKRLQGAANRFFGERNRLAKSTKPAPQSLKSAKQRFERMAQNAEAVASDVNDKLTEARDIVGSIQADGNTLTTDLKAQRDGMRADAETLVSDFAKGIEGRRVAAQQELSTEYRRIKNAPIQDNADGTVNYQGEDKNDTQLRALRQQMKEVDGLARWEQNAVQHYNQAKANGTLDQANVRRHMPVELFKAACKEMVATQIDDVVSSIETTQDTWVKPLAEQDRPALPQAKRLQRDWKKLSESKYSKALGTAQALNADFDALAENPMSPEESAPKDKRLKARIGRLMTRIKNNI